MRRSALAAASVAVALSVLATPDALRADEGMWTLNNFPSEAVGKKYGFSPSKEWLRHAQLSAARIGGGCSSSFVSKDGLVMTNHHCVHDCIENVSSSKKDYVKDGFLAKERKDEIKCPGFEVDQLVEITDVSDKIAAATKGLDGKAYIEAWKAESAKLEKACSGGKADVSCDVVSLYKGGRYDLYRYKRFSDVRVVFVPEFAMAFFGGDPDNFVFPRYDLDVAFVRVYENDQPAKQEHYFSWSKKPAKEGDLTFTVGNPARTSRLLTMAQLETERDVRLPRALTYLSEWRGQLTEFQHRGPEQRRVSNATLFYVENGVKAYKGRHEALLDKAFWNGKVAEENALRQKIIADPKLRAAYYDSFGAIEKAQGDLRQLYNRWMYMEGSYGFRSELATWARHLVRAAEERDKPNEKRLRDYTDAKLPGLEQMLFSTQPVDPEFETFTLTFSLTKLREALGADDPFVQKVLGKDSPAEAARKLVSGTKLRDLATRKALYQGGKKALDAAQDPLIELFRRIDPAGREVRKKYEELVESVERKHGELVAKARFAIYGTSTYPDATGTLRISYGRIEGYKDDGKWVKPITTIGGAFDRHTGQDPFALPASWLAAKGKLDLSLPMNFASTNDIIGGNSGSAVIDKDGAVVGLVFDGNLPSLGGDYGFDPSVNRAVSVHAAAIREALLKIYGAEGLAKELSP